MLKVSPFAIPREASFVAVADFAHEGGCGVGGRGKKKNEEGEVERFGSLRGPEDLVLWKSDFSRIRE